MEEDKGEVINIFERNIIMQQKLCGTCGAVLERKGDGYSCRYCGNKWVADAADDIRAVDRAIAWAALRDCDFERACELFENILYTCDVV